MLDLSVSISDRFRPALETLLTAYDYAADSHTDPWQFAVELAELLSSGATISDLRWLLLRNFALHAKETTVPGDPKRSFRPLVPTCFPADACLVLTTDGAAAMRSTIHSATLSANHQPATNRSSVATADPDIPASRVLPQWDATRRELRYAGQVVKRYRVPAENQALVLSAFQEDGWPEFIDDPLPPHGNQDPKQRLKSTIMSLNRNQVNPVIRFHGNGNGLQVYWEPLLS